MKKRLLFSFLQTKKISFVAVLLLNLVFFNTAKAQFPGYTMINYINNVVQYPANFAPASTADITDNQLNTCWYNIGYPAGAGILHMTWDTPFFDGPGNDVLIAIWNDNASGTANVRFQLSDNSFTSMQSVDFLNGLILSSGGSISPVGYNTITNSITSYPNTPRAKLLDIASFYNGALAVKGIEFSGFTSSHIDLLAIATTQNATPLPLTLSHFSCSERSGFPYLQWQTNSEINTSHFELQRSIDGINFSRIQEISAAGTSTRTQTYAYHDMMLNNDDSKVYYRLKMVDIDQQFIYSDVCTYQAVSNGREGVVLLQNPAVQYISFSGVKAGTGFSLLNAAGQTVYEGISEKSQNHIPCSELPGGVYMLRFAGRAYDMIKVTVANSF